MEIIRNHWLSPPKHISSTRLWCVFEERGWDTGKDRPHGGKPAAQEAECNHSEPATAREDSGRTLLKPLVIRTDLFNE